MRNDDAIADKRAEHRVAWYEGSSEPLDLAVDVGKENDFTDWFPTQDRNITSLDPCQQLIMCEEQDEDLNTYLNL